MFLLPGAVRKAGQGGILQTPGLVGEIWEAQFTAPLRYLCGPETQTSEGGCKTSSTMCCNVKCTSLNLTAFPDRMKHLHA